MPHHDIDRFDRPFDWEREQVFAGYDPVLDGFGYPIESPPSPSARCFCTIDPAKPEQATLCDPCIERLRCEHPSNGG